MTLKYHFVEVLENNYVWILEDSNKNVAVVDPGSFKEVDSFIKSNGFNVKQVLITHTHYDHIGGLEELIKVYSPEEVFVPKDPLFANSSYKVVEDSDSINVLGHSANVFVSSYHKDPHAFFYFKDLKYAFIGDLVFPYGIGRSFGTKITDLISMLGVVNSFDDNTLLFAAHEYGQANLNFLDKNGFGNSYISEQIKLIKEGSLKHTIPFTLASQKEHNAFFHSNSKECMKKINTDDHISFLTKLRKMRDVF